MCGGIVGALTVNMRAGRPQWPLHLAYNLGRISSYALAGALLGAVGSAGLLLNDVLPVQLALYVLANLMLVALGLYLTRRDAGTDFPRARRAEGVARIQPLTRRFLPATSIGARAAAGHAVGLAALRHGLFRARRPRC